MSPRTRRTIMALRHPRWSKEGAREEPPDHPSPRRARSPAQGMLGDGAGASPAALAPAASRRAIVAVIRCSRARRIVLRRAAPGLREPHPLWKFGSPRAGVAPENPTRLRHKRDRADFTTDAVGDRSARADLSHGTMLFATLGSLPIRRASNGDAGRRAPACQRRRRFARPASRPASCRRASSACAIR